MTLVDHLNLVAPALLAFCGSGIILLLGLLPIKSKYLAFWTSLTLVLAFAWLVVHHLNQTESIGLSGAVKLDAFSIFFSLIIVGATIAVVLATQDWAAKLENEMEFYALLLTAVGGMLILTQANDLITIFIAIETISLSQFILAAVVRDDRGAEAGLKYLLTGAVAAAVLLYGLVFLFGISGSTSLDSISQFILSSPEEFKLILLLTFIFITAGVGYKMALAPFHGWAPDIYQGAPSPVGAFLSVASKAAGFAIALRILYGGLAGGDSFLADDMSQIFSILAIASMIIGNTGALRQTDAKRLLGYSSIAQAGNIAVGLAALAVGSTLGAGAIAFFIGAYLFTNLGAFLCVHIVEHKGANTEIAGYAGMLKRSPFLAVVLTISLLSLTGIPPTVGFVAKVYVFNAAITAGNPWLVGLVAVAVINTAISAYYYLRWVRIMWLEDSEESATQIRPNGSQQFVLAIMALGVVLLGVLPNRLINLAKAAAETLM